MENDRDNISLAAASHKTDIDHLIDSTEQLS